MTLLRAMDVSSYQPEDLSFLIRSNDVSHVIVRLYQPIENPPQSHSLNQVASARLQGCTVSGYYWLYRDVNIETQVDSVVALAKLANISPSVPLLLDWEEYKNTFGPTPEQVALAILRARYLGYTTVVYSRKQFLEEVWTNAAALLTGVPLLLANYNGKADLEIDKPLGFEDSELVGHQYASSPVDLDVVLPMMTGSEEEPVVTPAAASYAELESYIGYLSFDLANGFADAVGQLQKVKVSKAVAKQQAPHIDQLKALTAVLRGGQ